MPPRRSLPVLLCLALGSLPALAGPPRFDRQGDPLPPGAVARLGTVRLRAPCYRSALSPDGKVVHVKTDRHIEVCDAATGAFLHQLRTDDEGFFGSLLVAAFGEGPGVAGLTLSADGKTLAAGAGGDMCIWDAASGRLLRRIPMPDWGGAWLTFCGGDKILAVSDSQGTRAGWWDIATGKRIREWQPSRKEKDLTIAFSTSVPSPDGRTLAVTEWTPPEGRRAKSQPGGTVWDAIRRKELWRLPLEIQPLPIRGAFSPDGRTLAVSYTGHRAGRFGIGETDRRVGRAVHLWETATGRPRGWLEGHREAVNGVAWSPDGRFLASGSDDSTILVWDMSDPLASMKPKGEALTTKELAALWEDLASLDAVRAYRAIGRLAGSPRQTVAFLGEHLRPVAPPDPARLRKLVAGLDARRFGVRRKAAQELAGLQEAAAPALRARLKARPSLEYRRRVERLLARLEGVPPPERLRGIRAVEVLERVSNPEARRVLESLAGGAPEVLLTREARAAVRRLPAGNATIRGKAGPSDITITTTARLAGAIHSLTWNGKEFIDSYDHGRQLQSAANFDAGRPFHPETFNPTEAGARADGTGDRSSSKLLRFRAAGAELESITQMAFWLAPGEKSAGHPALNDRILSDHLLTKRVRIGYKALPHAIEYEVSFTVPKDERHTYAQFEALTGYMPAEFDRFWKFLPSSGELKELDDGPGEQPYPVVLATASGSHAMGVYSPDQPSPGFEKAGYGRFRFKAEKVNKWNCVFRVRDSGGIRPGAYRFRLFVVVGTLADVRTTLATLAKEFKTR